MNLPSNLHNLGSISSCSDSSSHSASSMALEEEEEVTSSATSPGPLQDMSSLLHQLPLKRRGLSKHYPWKSQSFTSLASVACVEDLAKPENPYSKKLKTCRSYDGGSADQGRRLKITSKKSSRTRRSCFLGTRPPLGPHRSAKTSSGISNQTAMLA